MDATQEIEQRAQQAAQADADHCALCSISCVASTLASVYASELKQRKLFSDPPRPAARSASGRRIKPPLKPFTASENYAQRARRACNLG